MVQVAAWSLDASVADWLMIAWLRDVWKLRVISTNNGGRDGMDDRKEP